jgi:hypothetical protein
MLLPGATKPIEWQLPNEARHRVSRARGLLFYQLIQQAVTVEPVPYRSLIGGTEAHHNPASPR